ncbi:unnamed protein product [Sphagnum jensenii]
MSSSEADEVGAEDLTQDILEQRIINRFDYYTIQGGPHRRVVILWFLGFGVVTLVGIDPEVARVGDITVEIAHKRQRSVPRLGDLWIPKSSVLPNHFPRFYIPGVEDLFQVGDRIVRVEHSGSRSRLISWRVWRDSELKWQFQQESTDEQCFSILPSSLEPLIPVVEGAQFEFDG